jgi:hypothetical protein
MKLRDLDIELVRHLRLQAIVAAVLLASAAALGWYGQSDGSGRSFMIGLAAVVFGPVILAVLAIILAVLVRAGFTIAGRLHDIREAHLAAWSAPVVLATVVLATMPVYGQARMLRLQAIVADNLEDMERLRTMPQGGSFTWANGIRASFSIDPGPPRRAYFEFGGLADNSNGIVYDPTGRVAAARGWGPGQRFTTPEGLKELFGGDLLHCSAISGHYFFCGFT